MNLVTYVSCLWMTHYSCCCSMWQVDRMLVFWVTALCLNISTFCFGGAWCLHLQGDLIRFMWMQMWLEVMRILLCWRSVFKLHVCTEEPQKNIIDSDISVSTSCLKVNYFYMLLSSGCDATWFCIRVPRICCHHRNNIERDVKKKV